MCRDTRVRPHMCRDKSVRQHMCRDKSVRQHTYMDTSARPHMCRDKSVRLHSCRGKSVKPHMCRHMCRGKSVRPHMCRDKSVRPHSAARPLHRTIDLRVINRGVGRAASGGPLAPEPPRATRFQPESDCYFWEIHIFSDFFRVEIS